MEEWKEIAINRIKEVITCIENGDEIKVNDLDTENCPVCVYMKNEHNIVPIIDIKKNKCHGGWLDDDSVKYCAAWESCVKFVSILSGYLLWYPRVIRRWTRVRNRYIKKLQGLIDTLNTSSLGH